MAKMINRLLGAFCVLVLIMPVHKFAKSVTSTSRSTSDTQKHLFSDRHNYLKM